MSRVRGYGRMSVDKTTTGFSRLPKRYAWLNTRRAGTPSHTSARRVTRRKERAGAARSVCAARERLRRRGARAPAQRAVERHRRPAPVAVASRATLWRGRARPAVCVWGARTCAGDRPVAGTPGLLVFRNTWRLQHTARAAHTRGPRHTSAHAACTCHAYACVCSRARASACLRALVRVGLHASAVGARTASTRS